MINSPHKERKKGDTQYFEKNKNLSQMSYLRYSVSNLISIWGDIFS